MPRDKVEVNFGGSDKRLPKVKTWFSIYMSFTFYLAGIILFLCILGFFLTYLSEYLQAQGYFGDSIKIPVQHEGWTDNTDGVVDRFHIWGARHYWYYWCCVLLFLTSIVRVFIWAIHFLSEETNS